MLNVKFSNDYRPSIQNDKSLRGHCTKWDKKSEKRCDLRWQQKTERGGQQWRDVFHRRATATGNALSPTVDRRVRRTSRDVDEAERSARRLAWVSAGRRICSLSHRYVGVFIGSCNNPMPFIGPWGVWSHIFHHQDPERQLIIGLKHASWELWSPSVE